MADTIKTGLMAYGMSGRIFHAPFVALHPGFDLKAVVERHEKKAAADYPGITSYNSVDELLADKEIEFVIVNTPPYTHFELAQKALEANKHVLIEKPIATSSKEVKTLFDLGREVGKHVMVYQNRRWDSDFTSVRKVIESGRLGELIEVHFRFDRYKAALSPKVFKETKNTPGSGLVYDLGPHLIDQAISLFGRPLSFKKTSGIYRENSQVPDYFHFHLEYPHQLNVYLTSGLLIAQPTPSFVVHGTLGSYLKNRVDVQEAQLDKMMRPDDPKYGVEPAGEEGLLVTVGADTQKTTEIISSEKGDYSHLFEAVYQTIRNNALYPITEEHIAWQMELLEA
ncbi:Gfo/Idh/MocA family oxidoreductase [Mucilaginibacter ginsenosidivorans]|uniref:Oxidoreductase n=1 Tax=Mucilaginibacter ginsenosidivorans TaxID=398053 RepID=A0A5B8UQJ5_9SPHI|nr:Gfo/Idh/MocA family oxidoreductase [Mucilaginibacter ginsenosidivorans]QEC61370.1 oxidoreductase [Mucilaginibacter ginsenosidivorans]